MRIALLNTIRGFGGGEKRVLQAQSAFQAQGHAVLVVGRAGSALVERCAAEDRPHAGLPLGAYWSPRGARRLGSAFASFGADSAVCYDQRSVRLATLAGRLGAGGPSVVYYYGGEGTFRNRPYNRWVVTPRIARFVPNAEALRQELLSFGWIPADRVQVIYDGLDPAPILQADPRGVREQLGTQPGAVVCLTVARLVAGKGHELLLQAFARLASRFPELDLWFAGDGPELEALRARAEGLGVAARVQFLGFRRDVPRLLRAADLLCHPSRKEGAPNSVREAMAAGLPVAAVAASGTPELMVEGETGFLSPVDDVPKLAANLERLVSSRELRARMGEAGRRRALAEFSENVCTERWLALLESCLQEKPATPGR